MSPGAIDLWAIAAGVGTGLLASLVGGVLLGVGLVIKIGERVESEHLRTGRDLRDPQWDREVTTAGDHGWRGRTASNWVLALSGGAAAFAGAVTAWQSDALPLCHAAVVGIIGGLISLWPTKEIPRSTGHAAAALSVPSAVLGAALIGLS